MKKIYIFVTLLLVTLSVLAQQNQPDQIPYQRFDSTKYVNGIQKINLYVHLDCGRCNDAITMYQEAGIPYTLFDMANDSISVMLDRKITASISVADRGKGYAIRFPVIEINNDVYFCIENHFVFNNALVRFFESQKRK